MGKGGRAFGPGIANPMAIMINSSGNEVVMLINTPKITLIRIVKTSQRT